MILKKIQKMFLKKSRIPGYWDAPINETYLRNIRLLTVKSSVLALFLCVTNIIILYKFNQFTEVKVWGTCTSTASLVMLTYSIPSYKHLHMKYIEDWKQLLIEVEKIAREIDPNVIKKQG